MNLSSYRILCFTLLFGSLYGAASIDAAVSPKEAELVLQRAITNVQSVKSLAALKMEKSTTVLDRNEKILGSSESVDVATVQAGKTIWKNVSKKHTGDMGMTINLTTFVDTAPETVLDGYGTWIAQGEKSIGGERLLVWKGEKTEKEDKTTALVYISPQEAKPRRVDLDLPMRAFGVTSFKVVVVYGDGPKGTWVPTMATSEIRSQFLFRKRHILITKSFHDWTERPAH